jgi:hypothetical protein
MYITYPGDGDLQNRYCIDFNKTYVKQVLSNQVSSEKKGKQSQNTEV